MRKHFLINKLHLGFALIGSLLIFFIAYPLAKTILSTNPKILWQTLHDQEVLQSIILTFFSSAIATLIAFILGLPLAYLLARTEFHGKKIIEAIIDIPVVIPHSAAGIALLMVFGRKFLLGKLFGLVNIRFVSATPGIIIAMLFVSLSFFVNAARDGFKSVNPRLEGIARSLGASPWETFWQISFPLAWRNILSGIIMMWARGLSEFGAVVILAYHPMITPVLVYERFESFGLNYTRPIATIIILISLIAFIFLRLIGQQNHVKS